MGSFPSLGHVSEIHDHDFAQAVLERGGGGQRRAFFLAFSQTVVRVLVGEKKMLEDLRGIPLPFRSLGQRTVARFGDCLLQFAAQAL